MAKKKKRKEPEKKSTGNLIELKGIGLVLVAIIGCCPFGLVANIFKGFSSFLVGVWWAILLVLVGVCGIYMIIKREMPKLLAAKYLGLYIMLLAVLILSHTAYVDKIEGINVDKFKFIDDTTTVVKATIDNMMAFINNKASIQGGGIFGALFCSLLVSILTMKGTIVVSIALLLVGFIMFTGISIYDVFKKTGSKVKGFAHLVHQANISDGDDDDEDYEEDYDEVEEEVPRIKQRPVMQEIKHQELHEEHVEPVENHTVTEEVPVMVNGETGEVIEIPVHWEYPPISLLVKNAKGNSKENQDAIKNNIPILIQVLQDFGIEGKVVSAHVGPAVTQYELEIKAGTKVSKITGLNREIALALAAKDVIIQAPIPGKSTIGIELPNKKVSMVGVREVLARANEEDKNHEKKLLAVLGRDVMGECRWMEINKTPHLLVAGSTGSGKSVCINSILASILMRSKPDEVKLVLVDPKKVELSGYNGVPHLLAPVVTNPQKANIALKKIVVEMERRYDVFEASGNKNIESYNKFLKKKNEEGENHKLMPYIVVIIDELADLMMVAAKEVEDSIMRITQMARAAGIHLIVATQRPSTNVITGVIKANIPSRIAFAVSSGIDSRTILDKIGAEKLLGKGDMLYLPQGENTPIRIQGTFISEEETKAIVDFVCAQQKAHYDETLTMDDEEARASTMVDDNGNEKDATEEPLYDEIVEFVMEQGKASTSLIQRRFRLGYNRAARCMDLLEERGIVGPQNGSKPREVLIKGDEE